MSEPRLLGAVLKNNSRFREFQTKYPPLAPDIPTADGLAFCDTCKGRRLLRHNVPVEHPDFGKLIACPACPPEVYAAQTQARLARLWQAVPEHFRDFTLESYPGSLELARRLRVWIETDWWLYLYGGIGRGKSGLAVALLRELIEQGRSGVFVVVPDMLARIRRTYGSREDAEADEATIMGSLYDADVLVLDDLGSERVTDWVQEKLFQVIGHRHDHRKRTILTSNLDPAQLGQHLHPRTASRVDEACGPEWVVEVSGPNLRHKQRAA